MTGTCGCSQVGVEVRKPGRILSLKQNKLWKWEIHESNMRQKPTEWTLFHILEWLPLIESDGKNTNTIHICICANKYCTSIYIYIWSYSIYYIELNNIVYIGGLSRKSPAIVNIMRSLRDIDVTWQPRRVDWNVHGWTMMASLY